MNYIWKCGKCNHWMTGFSELRLSRIYVMCKLCGTKKLLHRCVWRVIKEAGTSQFIVQELNKRENEY